MLGSIAGAICGSPYEGGSCEPARFKFFTDGCCFTDDTVCTIAVADALLSDGDFAAALRRWVSRYPGRGYGGLFINWATSTKGPYNSFGNGGAMRVSPCVMVAQSLEEAELFAEASARVTHNHPDGILGAKAIAAALWWAGHGVPSPELRQKLTDRFGYDLRASVASRAEIFGFSTLAEETVPDALVCALEAHSWEDAVRNAVRIGGDSDTVACMAGGIAEAQHGLPARWARRAYHGLPADMQEVLLALYAKARVPAPWLAEEPPETGGVERAVGRNRVSWLDSTLHWLRQRRL